MVLGEKELHIYKIHVMERENEKQKKKWDTG